MRLDSKTEKKQTKPIIGDTVQVEALFDFGQRKKGDKWEMSKSTAEACLKLPEGKKPIIKILA